jgi:nucleoside-diphosphate-sugar epimerase
MPRTVGVTGSNGFLGSALIAGGRRIGLDMRPITLPRDMTRTRESDLARLLGDPPWDAVIHAAAARFPRSTAERFLNARAPALLRRALDHGVRLIHVSSLNVLIDGATDAYTESKTQGELGLSDQSAVIVVRPSMIWDPLGLSGNAGRLRKAITRIPFAMPVPVPGPSFRPVDVVDLANEILHSATDGEPPALVNIMGERSFTLRELTDAIARDCGKSICPLPVETLTPRPLRRFLPRAVRREDPDHLEPPRGLERGLDRYLPPPLLVGR